MTFASICSVQLLHIRFDRLDDRDIDICRLGHLDRVFFTGCRHQVGTDRTRNPADNDPLAKPVTQRRDEPDEILVAREDHEQLDIRAYKRGVDDVDDQVQVRTRCDFFPAVGIGRFLGWIMMRFETRNIEAGARLQGMLLEIGICAGHGHQSVFQCLVTPCQRVWFPAK